MSWLDDLRSKTEFSSNRKLATAMLDHGSWPADSKKLSPVSLANQLNQANRGERLEWWRPGGRGDPLLPTLAAVLGVDAARLRAAFDRAGGEFFSFDDFDRLPPINLESEELPDWLPPWIAHPVHGTWWEIRPGTCTDLVGRWLEVRKGWTCIRGASGWDEVASSLPRQGNVFVVLERSEGVPALARLPGQNADRVIVIACPERPHRDSDDSSDGQGESSGGQDEAQPWSTRLLDEHRWIPRLRDWVDDRLGSSAGSNTAKEGPAWEMFEAAGYLDRPGDMLFLMGLFDQVDVSTMTDGAADDLRAQLAQAWWAGVCQRVGRHAPEIASSVREAGWVLVERAEARRLTLRPDEAPDRDTWATLLPAEMIQPDVDDAIIRDLQSSDPALKAAAISRLRSPSATEVMDGLRAAGVFRPDGAGLSIGPEVIADLVRTLAIQRLLKEEPESLGGLLLRPDHSAEVLAYLTQAAEEGDWNTLERALDRCDVDTPAGAALLDGLVRTVGWTAVATTGSGPPAPLCQRLWDLQTPLLLTPAEGWFADSEPGQPPRPVLQVAESPDRADAQTRPALWMACRLGLSWTLFRAGKAPPLSVDSPWTGELSECQREKLAGGLRGAESCMYWRPGGAAHYVRIGPDEQVILARFGSQMFDHLGLLRHCGALLQDWQGPALICEAALGRLDAEEVEHVRRLCAVEVFPLAAVEATAHLRGVPLEQVLAWASEEWTDGKRLPSPLLSLPERHHPATGQSLEVTRELWQALPPERFTAWLAKRVVECASVMPWLSEAQWDAVLVLLQDEDWSIWEYHSAVLLPHLSEGQVRTLLMSLTKTAHLWPFYSFLWATHPSVMVEVLDAPPPKAWHRQKGTANSMVFRILLKSPPDETPALVNRVARWLESPALVPDADPTELRWWLVMVMDRRLPGWEAAWAVLRGGSA